MHCGMNPVLGTSVLVQLVLTGTNIDKLNIAKGTQYNIKLPLMLQQLILFLVSLICLNFIFGNIQ